MITSCITIDGSQGEGGGQILRSTIGLAMVSGKSVRIENIRAGRNKPGLMRQHLTAINAAAEVCGAKMSGAELRSCAVEFAPQAVRAGRYHFSIGTAGSATLVLQTILPALLTADGASEVIIEGGTHNQWAPPFDFLQRSFLPLINRMGPHVHATLERYGFYPAGGGRIVVQIEPAKSLAGFDLLDRGACSRSARVLISNLHSGIADREANRLIRKLSLLKKDVIVEAVDAEGPGNIVFVDIASEHVTEVVTGFGRTGASAEQVAEEAVKKARRYLTTTAPVGEYLADQLLLPLGLSAAQSADCSVRRGGSFRTLPLSRHSQTHIDILSTMLPVQITVDETDSDVIVRVLPAAAAT